MIDALRSGNWLTRKRIRGYSLVMLAFACVVVTGWIALSQQTLERHGQPLGTDFASFYAAGSLAAEGRPQLAYDSTAHYARQKELFGPTINNFVFPYPPMFLALFTPLAQLPKGAALLLWQATSFAACFGVIAAIVRRHGGAGLAKRDWLLPALAFPAVLVNLGHGQTGALTAALLGGGLLALPSQPVLAGILFGLLAYKPQFCVLIPVALVAGGHWRTLAAGVVTLAVTVLATTALFGIGIWHAFFGFSRSTQRVLLELGAMGFEKMQSLFAALRLWGAPVPVAYAAQGLLAVAVAVSLVRAWRRDASHERKAELLLIATLLVSPYVVDYDLMLLAPALAFAACHGLRRGFAPFEITLLAAAWTMPLLSRIVATTTGLPLGLIVLAALFAFYAARK